MKSNYKLKPCGVIGIIISVISLSGIYNNIKIQNNKITNFGENE